MIKNTHLYNIVFSRDDYMEVLMKLENHQDSIYPVKAKKVISNLDHATSMEDRNPYNEVLDELYNVMDVLHIERVDRPVQSAFLNVREILDYISEIHQKLDDINEIKRGIKKDYYENQEAIELISCLNRDRISIDDIHELKYVALRFGKLPLSQIEKIKYFDSYPFVYQELSHTDQFAWIVYGGVEHSIGEIDNIFSSMNFEEVKLPKFAHGKMEEAVAELKAEDKTMEAYLQELDQRIEKVKEENEEQLLGDFWKTYRLKELYKKGKYVVDLKTKAAVYAFSSFNKNELEDIVNVPGITIHELPIDTYQDQGIEGPVYVENNTFFQPFECLFTFKPGEKFDPTVIAGVVMMLSALVLLGDLGVGVLAILLSFIIKGNISKLLQRVGAAVTIGGLLSGTVFYSMSLYNSIFVVGTNYAMQIGLFFVINIALLLVCSLVKKVTKRSTKSKGGLVMAIAKLNLVSLDFDKDNCNDVLLELYQRDDFHPELASKFTDSVAGLSAYNNDNLYEELLSRIEEMKTKYHFEVPEVETDSQLNVFRAKEFLDDLFLDIDRIDAVKKELTKMIEENEEAIITLNHVEGSNIDFDQLFGTQYLKIRFGKLPLNNEGKLEYYETLPLFIKHFKEMINMYGVCI